MSVSTADESGDGELAARVLASGISVDRILRDSVDFPIQLWRFGPPADPKEPSSLLQLEWAALAGEPTIDYAMRIRASLGQGQGNGGDGDAATKAVDASTATRVWTSGYCTEVMAYVPSERVLHEGGYEGGESMVFKGLPSRFATGIEDRIVRGVEALRARLEKQAGTQ